MNLTFIKKNELQLQKVNWFKLKMFYKYFDSISLSKTTHYVSWKMILLIEGMKELGSQCQVGDPGATCASSKHISALWS